MAHLKEKALAAMRKIARAKTENEFKNEVESLKADDELWSNNLYKKYMENTWLKQHKVGLLYIFHIYFLFFICALRYRPVRFERITSIVFWISDIIPFTFIYGTAYKMAVNKNV